MPPQLVIIFVLAVGLPFGWLLSEFQPRRWLRILLGSLALTMSAFLAFAFSQLERFNYNAWYGSSSAELIDATIVEIEGGRTDGLASALRELRADFEPTYTSRAHYNDLVDEFVNRVKANRPTAK